MKKRDNRKIYGLILVSLLLTVMVSSVVMAQGSDVKGFFENFWKNWQTGKFSEGAAKVLLVIVISLFIFSAASKIPGLEKIFKGDKEFLGFIFSLIVGFLAMAYITPEEVYAIMTTYSALGFVLSAGVPFLVLLFFTITLATEPEGGAKGMIFRKLIAYLMWVVFVVFLLYRIVLKSGEVDVSAVYGTFAWIILILSVVILVSLPFIFKKIRKMVHEEIGETMKETLDLATKKEKAEAAAAKELGGASGKTGTI